MVTTYITTDYGDWQAAPRVTGYESRYITWDDGVVFTGHLPDGWSWPDGWYLAPTQTHPSLLEIRRDIPVRFGACHTNEAYRGNPTESD